VVDKAPAAQDDKGFRVGDIIGLIEYPVAGIANSADEFTLAPCARPSQALVCRAVRPLTTAPIRMASSATTTMRVTTFIFTNLQKFSNQDGYMDNYSPTVKSGGRVCVIIFVVDSISVLLVLCKWAIPGVHAG
jgi:hypothetical protein